MRSCFAVVVFCVGVAACGPKPKPAANAPTGPAPASGLRENAQIGDPGTALIGRERDVWTLEGLLVAEADAILRAPEARSKLGDPRALASTPYAEHTIRGYLRDHRSAATKQAGAKLVSQLNRPSRELLARAAEQGRVKPEDVFLDYLTFDGLLDLALMRSGYARWKAGRLKDPKLGDAFFGTLAQKPSAAQGISVVSSNDRTLDVRVFGATVRAEIKSATVKFAPARGSYGVVAWLSPYERLRATIRGAAEAETSTEELDYEGGSFAVNYAAELEEYLSWSATSPWASVLYMMPTDDVADLWTGAAAGSLEATTAARDPDKLPDRATLDDLGLTARVVGAAAKRSIAGVVPRRGQFVVVTVELEAKEETRAPADWFRLAIAKTELAEFGVTRPGLEMAVLIDAPRGAKTLSLPYTQLAKGKTTVVLIYDVTADVTAAALLLGPNDVAMKVKIK